MEVRTDPRPSWSTWGYLQHLSSFHTHRTWPKLAIEGTMSGKSLDFPSAGTFDPDLGKAGGRWLLILVCYAGIMCSRL